MKRTRSYLLNTALACCVLYWVYDLSRSGRTAIDWVVLSLVGSAILWNVWKLGERLYRSGGGTYLWHLQRTLLFWIIGLLNTLLARPEAAGTWRVGVGWTFLVVALLDSIVLFRKEQEPQGGVR